MAEEQDLVVHAEEATLWELRGGVGEGGQEYNIKTNWKKVAVLFNFYI